MNIRELMSERAQDNSKFSSIILDPTQKEFDNLHKFIQVFPHLVAIDYAPDQFMPYLSAIFDYNFLETEDPDVQREILKRLVNEFHKKGLVSTLQKIANRAHSDNFLIGDLTYYHGKLVEGYSSITYPRDRLFRYDYSKWDGPDRWPDAKEWRDGVVQIDISMPTDPYGRILDMIDENLAAGLKYYISILRDISGDIGYVDMVYKVSDDIYDQTIYADYGILEPYVIEGNYFRYDFSRWDNAKWGSRELISVDHWEEPKPQAGIYDVYYPDDFGYQVEEVYDHPISQNMNRFRGIIDGTEASVEQYG